MAVTDHDLDYIQYCSVKFRVSDNCHNMSVLYIKYIIDVDMLTSSQLCCQNLEDIRI